MSLFSLFHPMFEFSFNVQDGQRAGSSITSFFKTTFKSRSCYFNGMAHTCWLLSVSLHATKNSDRYFQACHDNCFISLTNIQYLLGLCDMALKIHPISIRPLYMAMTQYMIDILKRLNLIKSPSLIRGHDISGEIPRC